MKIFQGVIRNDYPLHEQTYTRNGQSVNIQQLVNKVGNKKPIRIPVGKFIHYLDNDLWFGGEEVTVNEFITHYNRIKAADLSYPILVHQATPDEVIDGLHRLVKAITEGHTYIMAIEVTDDDLRKAQEF